MESETITFFNCDLIGRRREMPNPSHLENHGPSPIIFSSDKFRRLPVSHIVMNLSVYLNCQPQTKWVGKEQKQLLLGHQRVSFATVWPDRRCAALHTCTTPEQALIYKAARRSSNLGMSHRAADAEKRRNTSSI